MIRPNRQERWGLISTWLADVSKIPPSHSWGTSLAAVLSFAVAALVGLLKHELWGDELQSWMLARDSSSILELLHNMRFEGHPALWHMLLWGLAQISHNPSMMQLLSLLIGISIAGLINFCSPFSRSQRVLLTFSYFTFYEYTIISRSYGLGVFLAFLFCALSRGKRPVQSGQTSEKHPFGLARVLVLVALANTSLYGLMLSVPLSLYLVNDYLESRQQCSLAKFNILCLGRLKVRSLWVSGLILMGGWLLSIVQILRALQSETLRQAVLLNSLVETAPVAQAYTLAAQSSLAIAGGDFLGRVKKISHLSAYVWKSYVPIPQLHSPDFWNTSVFSDTVVPFGYPLPGLGGINIGQALTVFLSVALLFSVYQYCLQRPITKVLYLMGNALFFGLSYYFLPTGIRHSGHLFILLMICLWLDRIVPVDSQLSRKQSKPLAQALLSIILCAQALVAGYAYSLDWTYAFTGAEQAVAFIEANQLDRFPMIGLRTWETSTFSGYLDQPIYYPELGQMGSFALPPKPQWSSFEGWEPARKLIGEKGGALVILDETLSIYDIPLEFSIPNSGDRPTPPISIRWLGTFQGDIVTKESYSLYLAQPIEP